MISGDSLKRVGGGGMTQTIFNWGEDCLLQLLSSRIISSGGSEAADERSLPERVSADERSMATRVCEIVSPCFSL